MKKCTAVKNYLILILIVCVSNTYGQSSRIVGGENEAIKNTPWQVALLSDGSQFCGGSIIDSNWILTAAHCLVGESPEDIQIGFASDVLTDAKMQTIQVNGIFMHPNYDGNTQENDIALISLNQAIPLSDSAAIIPLITKQLEAEGATDDRVIALVSGWGLTEEDGQGTDTLQSVYVPIVSNESANATNRYNGQVTEDMLCAGNLALGGKDACQGDSGGPMAVRAADSTWHLAGVVSWGEGCANADYPGVYARVAYFEEWITNIIEGGPIANFEANQVKVFAGESVTFSDKSINNPTAWTWILEGASNSNTQNPVVEYATEGTYDVTLIVSNGSGADTLLKEDFIEVIKSVKCDSLIQLGNPKGNLTLDAFDSGYEDDFGYYAGINSWNVEGVFETFIMNEERSVSGVSIQFGVANSSNENESVTVAVFKENESEPILSKKVLLSAIRQDILKGEATDVDFGGALNVGTKFYVGVLFTNESNAEVGIFSSNSDVDYASSFYGEWEGEPEWYSFEDDYNVKKSLAIKVTACKLPGEIGIIDNIGDEALALSSKLYPNPNSTGFVMIDSKSRIESIKIYTSQGVAIRRKAIDHNSAYVSIAGLRKGVYFIEVNTKEESAMKKLIVE